MKNHIWAGLCFLYVVLPALAYANLSGSDDFNDNFVDSAKWGTDFVANYGTFTETNQRLEYTATTMPYYVGLVRHQWIGSYGSYTENWTVQADVNLVDLTMDGSEVIGISLMVFDTADASTDTAGLTLALNNTGYAIHTNMQYTSAELVSTSSGSVSFQLQYDSATHSLIESYDANGAEGGYLWTYGTTYDLTSWGMTDSSLFQVELTVGMNTNNTRTITSGQAYADNLSMTPEPSTNLLLIAACMGLAAACRCKRSSYQDKVV